LGRKRFFAIRAHREERRRRMNVNKTGFYQFGPMSFLRILSEEFRRFLCAIADSQL
jgi:hypothetical protein